MIENILKRAREKVERGGSLHTCTHLLAPRIVAWQPVAWGAMIVGGDDSGGVMQLLTEALTLQAGLHIQYSIHIYVTNCSVSWLLSHAHSPSVSPLREASKASVYTEGEWAVYA